MAKKTIEINAFWHSPDFWIAAVMVIGGLWAGFSTEMANDLVHKLFAFLASAGGVYKYVRESQPNFKKWIGSKNTWNYLAIIFTMVFGTAVIPPGFWDALQRLAEALFGDTLDWQAIFGAVFSLATVIYYWVRDGKAPASGSVIPDPSGGARIVRK